MKKFRQNPKAIFFVSFLIASLWFGFSIILNTQWIQDISSYVPYPFAFIAVLGIAILPGFIYVFLLLTLTFFKTESAPHHLTLHPNLSILIAAYNEEHYIKTTIEKILATRYEGTLEIIVINDGSTDRTREILTTLKQIHPQIRVLDQENNMGKSPALNKGLRHATYDYIVTVDADTWLHEEALTEIMKPMFRKEDVGAVAGSIIVQNENKSWITRLQVWDYFISIAAVKRQQSIYEGTLVAQGAFSLYRKKAILEVGGWLDVLGEDIVLTWGILKNKYRVYYAEKAIGFTHVPSRLLGFLKQRKRWARGLFEAFREHPNILFTNKGLSRYLMFLNVFFPLIDFTVLFILLPGILLAIFFQWYLLAGVYTLLVLPLTLLLTMWIYNYQAKVFHELNIQPPRKISWAILFLLSYSFIQAPATLTGYMKELFSFKKRW